MAAPTRLLDRLPAFALPFVTRSLRGGRGRRFVALSFALAMLTAVACLWIGLSDGRMARSLRADIGIEMRLEARQRYEFVVFDVDDEFRYESLADRQSSLHVDAFDLLLSAAGSEAPPAPPEHADLQREARVLLRSDEPYLRYEVPRFNWNDEVAIHRLGKIVEYGRQPPIVRYTSTVGLDDTLRLLAMVTGGLLVLLLTVLAPLLVALQQASERHENTLQPLTGTSLGAIELCVGLACGPLAIVAILATPIAALYLGAAIAIGEFGSLWLLPLLAGITIGLVFGAQLLAHVVGARRAPGMIAVALLCLLGLLGFVGLGLASGPPSHELFGLSAVVPQTGLFQLLGESFGDPWRATARAQAYFYRPPIEFEFIHILVPTVVGSVGATVLGLLALRALARHVEGRVTLLDAGEAWVGALVCITMTNVAIPRVYEPVGQTAGLPMLAIPFLLLIMARIPIGDVPTKHRRIPLLRLIGEFAGWTAIHVVVAALDDLSWAGLNTITLLGISWCVGVLVLLAVRLVATPARILGMAWLAVCLGMVLFTFGFTSLWAFSAAQPPMRFVLSEFEVTLVWAVLLVLVPLSLVRHLRNHVASIQSKSR